MLKQWFYEFKWTFEILNNVDIKRYFILRIALFKDYILNLDNTLIFGHCLVLVFMKLSGTNRYNDDIISHFQINLNLVLISLNLATVTMMLPERHLQCFISDLIQMHLHSKFGGRRFHGSGDVNLYQLLSEYLGKSWTHCLDPPR